MVKGLAVCALIDEQVHNKKPATARAMATVATNFTGLLFDIWKYKAALQLTRKHSTSRSLDVWSK